MLLSQYQLSMSVILKKKRKLGKNPESGSGSRLVIENPITLMLSINTKLFVTLNLHTAEVGGSSPLAPTQKPSSESRSGLRGWDSPGCAPQMLHTA